MTSRNREGGVVTKHRQLGLPNPFEPSNSKSDDEIEHPLKTKIGFQLKPHFDLTLIPIKFQLKWLNFQLNGTVFN